MSDTTSGDSDFGIDLSEFAQAFFEEAVEHLANMEQLLLAIDPAAPSSEDLNAIFRAAHSIKGGSGMFGFNDLTELTHELESLLDKVRKGEMSLTPDMVDVLLEAGDMTKLMLDRHQGTSSEEAPDDTAMRARIRAFLMPPLPGECAPCHCPETATAEPAAQADEPTEPVAQADEPTPPAVEPPAAPVAEAAPAPAEDPLARERAEAENKQGFGFFDHPSAPAEAAPAQAAQSGNGAPAGTGPGYGRRASDWLQEDPSAGVNQGRRASDRAAAPAPQQNRRESDRGGAAAGGENMSIRVNIEKVDQLINQLGEVVITQAMLSELISRLDPVDHAPLFKCMTDLERNTRDLQESVMSIRMTPVSVVFNRTPRMVRDLAAKLGKQVQVVMEGEGTELDKGLIEKITDPLTHLVRNSVDHGIEMPDARVAAGKTAVGTVILRAFHQGGNIVIEIVDDGAGLSRDRIIAKARERGMNVPDTINDSDVWQLIFEAGFSTAEQVTDVSGRGVGMDVVKRNIQALGGRVEIDSKYGTGTRITIRLPLTLAILDGLSVAVSEHLFILPLSYIVESLQPRATDVKRVSNHGEVIQVRGEYLPVVKLHELFNLRPRVTDIEQGIMVILESDGMKKALFVDELLAQHQVVIKSLETNYRKVEGISGATIMGDGKVALIIDAGAIVRNSSQALLTA